MPEPATTSVTAASVSATVLFVSVFGPQAGPWALIVAASIGGGLFPLSGSETQSTREAIMILLRCALLAIFTTGMIARYLENTYGLPVSDGLALVALAIGAMGNGWRSIFGALGNALRALAGRLGGGS